MAYETEKREAQDRARAVGEGAREQARELGDQAKHEAAGVRNTVREDARDVILEGRSGAKRVVGEQKERVAAHIHEIGESIRGASESLQADEFGPARKYGQIAADRIDRAADYIRERDVEQLADDVGSFARRNPELFLGGAFLAGIAIGRFVRASSPRPDRMEYSSSSYDDDARSGGHGQDFDLDRRESVYGGDTGESFRAGDVRDTGPYGRAPLNPDRATRDMSARGRDIGRPADDAVPGVSAMGSTGGAAAGGHTGGDAGQIRRSAGSPGGISGTQGSATAGLDKSSGTPHLQNESDKNRGEGL